MDKEVNIKVNCSKPEWLKDHDMQVKTYTQLRCMLSTLRKSKCDYIVPRFKDCKRFGFDLPDLLPNVLEAYYQDRLKEEQEEMVSSYDKYKEVRQCFVDSENLRHEYSEKINRLENRSFLERVLIKIFNKML